MAIVISATELKLADDDLLSVFSTATGLNFQTADYEIETVEVGTDESGERNLTVRIKLKG